MHPNPHISNIRRYVQQVCVVDHDCMTWDAIEESIRPYVLQGAAENIREWKQQDPPGAAGLLELYRMNEVY